MIGLLRDFWHVRRHEHDERTGTIMRPTLRELLLDLLAGVFARR